MKLEQVVKVMAPVIGATTSELNDVNKALKAKTAQTIKFKIHGEKFGYIGLTVAIKGVTPEGLKIYDVNKVKLVRFTEIKSFEKAAPKAPRHKFPKAPVVAPVVKPRKNLFALTEKDKELESEEQSLEDAKAVKVIKPNRRPKSNFIPAKKSR